MDAKNLDGIRRFTFLDGVDYKLDLAHDNSSIEPGDCGNFGEQDEG